MSNEFEELLTFNAESSENYGEGGTEVPIENLDIMESAVSHHMMDSPMENSAGNLEQLGAEVGLEELLPEPANEVPMALENPLPSPPPVEPMPQPPSSEPSINENVSEDSLEQYMEAHSEEPPFSPSPLPSTAPSSAPRKKQIPSNNRHAMFHRICLTAGACFCTLASSYSQILFEDHFDEVIPGWTAVAPKAIYLGTPPRWVFDRATGAISENSNAFTNEGVAPMLINETTTGDSLEYRARINAGDDDGFGLVFGFQDDQNFYRITFAIQERTASYPWTGWTLERMNAGVPEVLAGNGGNGITSFLPSKNLPFEVIIGVVGNEITITAQEVDGELLTLVDALTLPTIATGRLGLLTWGQQGGRPRGTVFDELLLDTMPLLTDVPQLLDGWVAVVPANATGDAGLNVNPIWGVAAGANGAYGTLHEMNDSFAVATDIDGNTHIDFLASTLVNGDVNWTDYVLHSRIIPGDNDGHGAVLRYKDPDNFVRIALAGQGNGDGRVWQGVSVQQKANGVWSELFAEEAPQFVPPNNLPYELIASVQGNQLEIVIIDSANAPHSYGPITIDDALANGRIGVFSWGMFLMEVDFVRVESAEGLPLVIESPFETPSPEAGLNGIEAGTEVTASAGPFVEEAAGFRRAVAGWIGSGSVPVSGESNEVTFTMNEFSTLRWLWRDEYSVRMETTEGGTVTGAEDMWFGLGTQVTITAEPNDGFTFAGWEGASRSLDPSLTMTVTGPKSIRATFTADTDNDALPDVWEQSHFANLDATAEEDADSDGSPNLDEYQRGTDPLVAQSATPMELIPRRWENVQRDPWQPGDWLVADFGKGYRGVYDNSNDHRRADRESGVQARSILTDEQLIAQVSFDGPRIMVSESEWDPAWSDATVETMIIVADNDGTNVYFRYQDENNWMRVTMNSGQDGTEDFRPPIGVSVQKRVDGFFSQLAADDTFPVDPDRGEGFKQFLLTVVTSGNNFEVKLVGFLTNDENPPVIIPESEVILTFTDDSFSTGRVGIGSWGQSGTAATEAIPVGAGVMFREFAIKQGEELVFEETWDAIPDDLTVPSGWSDPFDESFGIWRASATSIVQRSADFEKSTHTALTPSMDVEGSNLLAPTPSAANFQLAVTMHPFDNDGIGFVYDYQGPDNFARVLFVSQSTADSRIPQGINVNRKVNGVWQQAIIIEDPSYIYTQGIPFTTELASVDGNYHLRVIEDSTDTVANVTWTDQPSMEGRRFGVHTWDSTEAHFSSVTYRSLSSNEAPRADIQITNIAVSNGQSILTIDGNSPNYIVERSVDLVDWQPVVGTPTVNQWRGETPDAKSAFWRLVHSP